MSRTYRRKDAWGFSSYEFEVNSFGFVQKKYLDKNSKEYIVKKAKYHKDSKIYGSSVPHWFVNLFCEKPLRQKTKHQIKKWMNNPNSSELIVQPYVRDAGWNYW